MGNGKKGPKLFTGIVTTALAGVVAFGAWQFDNVKLLVNCKPLVSETQYTEQKAKNAELEEQFQEQLQRFTELKEETETLQTEKETLQGEKQTLQNSNATLQSQNETLQNEKEALQGSNETLQGQNQNLRNELNVKDNAIADKQQELNNITADLNSLGIYFVNYKGTNEYGEEVDKVKLCNGTLNANELETPGDICAWSLDGQTVLNGDFAVSENKTLVPLYAGLYNTDNNMTWQELINNNVFVLENNNKTIRKADLSSNLPITGGIILLPKGLTTIFSKTFENFSGDVILPNTVTNIGSSAFKNSGITHIDFSNVKSIEGYAFQDCTSLENVELKEGLLSLGISAFKNCSGFGSIIVVPSTVNTLSGQEFYGTDVRHIVLPKAMTTSTAYLFSSYYPAVQSVYVPKEVTYFMLNDAKHNVKNYGINIYFEAETMPSTDTSDTSTIQHLLHTGYTLEQYLAEINTANT